MKENKLDMLVLIISFILLSLPNVNLNYLDNEVSSSLQYYGFLIIVIYFFVRYYLLLFSNNPKIIIPKINGARSYIIIILWIIFALSIIWSGLHNGISPSLGIGYLFITTGVFFIAVPRIFEGNEMVFAKVGFWSAFFFIVWSLLANPNIGLFQYVGVANNSNNLGLIAYQATLSSFFIIFPRYFLKKENNDFSIIYTIGFGISFFILLITSSRTALFAFIVGAFIIYAMQMKDISPMKIILTFFTGILVYIFFLRELIYESILIKVSDRATSNDLLSGRNDIWLSIIEDAKIFGHGETYFNETIGIAAHNSVLHNVGVYGWLPGIALLVFLIVSWILAFMGDDKKEVSFSKAYIISFIIPLMSETVFGLIQKSPTMLYFLLIGNLFFVYKRIGRNELE